MGRGTMMSPPFSLLMAKPRSGEPHPGLRPPLPATERGSRPRPLSVAGRGGRRPGWGSPEFVTETTACGAVTYSEERAGRVIPLPFALIVGDGVQLHPQRSGSGGLLVDLLEPHGVGDDDFTRRAGAVPQPDEAGGACREALVREQTHPRAAVDRLVDVDGL